MKPYVTRILIGLNVAVFLTWFFADRSFDLQIFLVENFLVSWTALTDGRVWTLVTSMFSHNLLWHLLMNMFALSSFGPILESGMGSWRFLKFYFLAGIVGSLSHAVVSAYIVGDPSLPAHGASGAISGLILLFALTFPKERLLILGIIPIPALVGSLLFVGLDVWGLYAQAGGGGLPIGHGAHLGGAAVGLAYYFFVVRRRLRGT